MAPCHKTPKTPAFPNPKSAAAPQIRNLLTEVAEIDDNLSLLPHYGKAERYNVYNGIWKEQQQVHTSKEDPRNRAGIKSTITSQRRLRMLLPTKDIIIAPEILFSTFRKLDLLLACIKPHCYVAKGTREAIMASDLVDL